MSRPPKLNWEPARRKWKIEYKGKKYRFDGGTGKSDRKAKKLAEEEWKKIKAKVDQLVRPHQEQYEQAIFEWERVLSWCAKHGDSETAQVATDKLESLQERLAASRLKPLVREDLFEGMFDVPIIADLDQILGRAPHSDEPLRLEDSAHLAVSAGKGEIDPERLASYAAEMDGTPARIAREIWRDRLENESRVRAPQKSSLHFHIAKFLEKKEREVQVDELSTGRLYKLRLHLTHFEEWLGRSTAVTEIDGVTLEDYRNELLSKVAAKRWKKGTVSDRFNNIRSFVRWLWRTEAIPALPRNLDDQSLCIGAPAAEIVEFTIDEIARLLKAASDRTKLFILMMLNTAMTQKDISDLLDTEVNWKDGRVCRKRSKTRDFEAVPTVDYLLWPETLRLLRKERAESADGRLLLNANGTPLWREGYGKKGKYQKVDNIRTAFERLRRKTGVKKPLKSLKKTSATLLRGSGKFTGLESLFLGHAPQSMSDKHYAGIPQNLLDEAIQWLRGQYRLDEMVDVFRPKAGEIRPTPQTSGRSKARAGRPAASR